MKGVYVRVPAEQIAAIPAGRKLTVVSFKRIQTNDNEFPLPLVRLPKNSNIPNCTGRKFGKFTVIGYAANLTGHWVVRCECGIYTTRRTRAVRNPFNSTDRCERCRQIVRMTRTEIINHKEH